MKAFFTCLLATLLLVAGACPSYAAGPLVIANFSAERGLPFSLLLDGQLVTRPTAQQVRLDRLAPGQHLVELGISTAPLGRGGQRVRATVWLEEGFETSFVLTQRPGYGWQLRQVGTAALPGYGYFDPSGAAPPPAPSAPPVYTQPGNVPPVGPGQPPIGGPAYPAGPSYAAVLDARDAADLLQRLSQYPFDDQRLPLFYQALSRTYVRADDLAAMVHTMTYPESQKKAAKYGYSHLIDPQNFHRVLDALTFSSDANAVLSDLGIARW